MEHPILFLVKLFEIIGLGDFAHHYPHVIYSWFVMLILIVFGLLATRGISMIPAKWQSVFEVVISTMEDFTVDITGEEGRPYFPILATVFLYIFVCNLIGLMPGLLPPTANLNTTLSCAIPVFIMTHIIGFRTHGFAYIKQFTGPIWWLAPLMLVLESIGHLARVMSLSIRLFGNMMGKELVLGILFMLAGLYLAPLPMLVLGLLVCFIQAFVFYLLSTMYFTLALEEAH
ncbi:MAG: F0F1 ATP synthase subunit A [Desulfobacterales bacterium]|nr:MAG: F0F1 ATP synthase subunit A [Desulfobacterales bacterium]UCG79998.1 MAG: F0F1 ATP synthase subunit A [Desulfobacterales bacterium]